MSQKKKQKFNEILQYYANLQDLSVRDLKNQYYSSKDKHNLFTTWMKTVKRHIEGKYD